MCGIVSLYSYIFISVMMVLESICNYIEFTDAH